MIEKNAILCIIFLITFLRAVIKRFRGDLDTSYLFVSLFVICTPFIFDWPVIELTGKAVIRGRNVSESLGVFGNAIVLTAPLLISLMMVVSGFYKVSKESLKLKNNTWLLVFIALCLISFINPYNTFKNAIFPALFSIIQLTILFKLFESNFDRGKILRGVFDGLAVLTLISLITCILYPILNIKEAVTFMYGQKGLLQSLRRAGYPATIGLFSHPNPLGFFTLIPIVFFISCYLNNYQNKAAVSFLILSNLFVCFFTFSRTSFLGILIAIVVLVLVYNNKAKLAVRKQTIVTIAIFSVGFLCLFLYLTFNQNLLLFIDTDKMMDAREAHWVLGYELWKQSEILGVGLNSHVYYMAHHDFSYTGYSNAFTVNVAIHNIHFIILAETGLLGIIAWFTFVVLKIKALLNFKINDAAGYVIFNMTFLAVLVGAIVVGIFDTSPSPASTLPLILFFGYFAVETGSSPVQSSRKHNLKNFV